MEGSLAPPLWMGPVEEAAKATEAAMPRTAAFADMHQDYGKLVEDGLADVVLLVKGTAFPRAPGSAFGAERVFLGSEPVGDAGGQFGGWGAGDRASQRGGVPDGAAVPVLG